MVVVVVVSSLIVHAAVKAGTVVGVKLVYKDLRIAAEKVYGPKHPITNFCRKAEKVAPRLLGLLGK